MAKFDLRYIQCAKYVNTNGTITFTDKTAVGDAMQANISLRFAEGRLYAESHLAEFIRKCTGGTGKNAVGHAGRRQRNQRNLAGDEKGHGRQVCRHLFLLTGHV